MLHHRKKILLALALLLMQRPCLAIDSVVTPPTITPKSDGPVGVFHYKDTYNKVMMPQGPLPQLITTANAPFQLQFYNNGVPTTQLTVPFTGYYQVYFSIEFQANTNVPVIKISNVSVAPVFPTATSGADFVIYPQCNNIALKYQAVPTDAQIIKTVVYLYYDGAATPLPSMFFAYKDSGFNTMRTKLAPADMPSQYSTILGILQAGTGQLQDAALKELYQAILTKVPAPNTPVLPYCVMQTISASAQGLFTAGAIITAPKFTTDSSVSVMGGEFSVEYLGVVAQ